MECTVDRIHPFIRYARFIDYRDGLANQSVISCDNRLFYCLEGKGTIQADGAFYRMSEGDLLLIRGGIEYRSIYPVDGNVTYVAVNFDWLFENSHRNIPICPLPASKFRKEDLLEQMTIADCTGLDGVVYLNDFPVVRQELLEIEKIYRQQLVCATLRLTGKFCVIVSKIVAEIRIRTSNCRVTNQKIEQIMDYIHRNYREQLTNRSIGEQFHFHPNYINSLMVSYTGYSLHQYLLRTRIFEAIRLLETSGTSVTDIA